MIDVSSPSTGLARSQNAESAVEHLQDEAIASQADISREVTSLGGEVIEQFWVSNLVLARVPAHTVAELAGHDDVEVVLPNFEVTLPMGEHLEHTAAESTEGDVAWGVAKVRADRVHADLGVTGAGVRVAVLDTGVDATHPDIASRLVTTDPDDPAHPGGWIEFDVNGSPVPVGPRDTGWHGTHVAGTIVGGDASGTQIGVAPGADLMVAGVLSGGTGTFAQVLAGMQWAMEPTDRHGNPAGEPADVVNMSLGQTGYFTEFIEPTRNMAAAGIFPAFSIGNWCAAGESSSPGNVVEAVAVGATDAHDEIGEFSCGETVTKAEWPHAPEEWPDQWVVPDVSAPGVSILSATPDGYGTASGTSMAAPHVAGTVALMKEADSALSVSEALEALCSSSYFDDRYGDQRPNSRYGCGRIDAWGAVAAVSVDSGVSGTVRDAGTGAPVPGATVAVDGSVVTTTQDGTFDIRLLPGTYELVVTRYGYVGVTRPGVQVNDDALTSVPLDLAAAPLGTARGTVRNGTTGEAVPGAVVVLHAGDRPSATTDKHGRYSLTRIPAGQWRIQATAPGFLSSTMEVAAVTGAAPAEVGLTLPGLDPLERVSVALGGGETTGASGQPTLNADGRFVAFQSTASEIDARDTNGVYDIYVTDRASGVTERITRAHDGGNPDFGSIRPVISADGRWVAFQSSATNLVEGDTNGVSDIFLHDRHTGETLRVSEGTGGVQSTAASEFPAISADGRWVAFHSRASNLVPGDTNGRQDVFLYDAENATLELVSRSASGVLGDGDSHAPSLSQGASFVVYHSMATNLLAGPDTNGRADVIVLNRETGVVQRASVTSSWAQANGHSVRATVSNDGRFVAFESHATNLGGVQTNGVSDIFVRDRQEFTTECLTCPGGVSANGQSSEARVSGDGSMVVFTSAASNLVDADDNGMADIFRTAVATKETDLVSRAASAEANNGSSLGDISDDGLVVAFQSAASNLKPDTNRQSDAYLRDLQPDTERPFFAVTDLRAHRANDRVRVGFVVANVGAVPGTYTAGIYVDGVLTLTREISVIPGEPENVLAWLDAEPGAHEVRVGPLTTSYRYRG